MRVVFAPDSFKGSATASDLAAALAAGWAEVRPADEVVLLPQADGGEGTVDAIAHANPDAVRHTVEGVTGPDSRPHPASWLLLPDGTAVIELAEASGLPLMTGLDPLGATTRGVGELIASALDAGAERLVIGLGGSASTDGGAGALQALGAQLLDEQGVELPAGGGALRQLARVNITDLRRPPAGGVRILTDTRAVLTGPEGAAHVFGPQKGADEHDRIVLDEALQHFADMLRTQLPSADPSAPGAGAAGGAGFGLGAWGGMLAPGAETIADITGLRDEFATADVIVTGEGRFDETSLTGKLVGSVLSHCEETGTRTVVVAGQLAETPPDIGVSLTEVAGLTDAALAQPLHWARVAGHRAAERLTTP